MAGVLTKRRLRCVYIVVLQLWSFFDKKFIDIFLSKIVGMLLCLAGI